ncbi:MAG: hypothetical protein FWF69_08780 [Firmicutes bacterium]|nr:hypothetical protein [Bacillota bacterium]
MDLYSAIFTRKSCRKYDRTSLGTETIEQIESFIFGLRPLLPNSEITYKIVGPEGVKGMAIPKAPHYLLISGKDQPLRNTYAGFLFQHVELYLCSMGFAACWNASLKGKQNSPDNIMGFAFGKPAESGIRKPQEFKRKSMREIAAGTDPRLEAVRLAPSGRNEQPWYFIVEGGAIHVYYMKSIGGLLGMVYHFTDFDVGIALCHLAVASHKEGKPFSFSVGRKDTPIPPKGFTYIGTVEGD